MKPDEIDIESEEDPINLLQDGKTCWSPYGAESAARNLRELLEQKSCLRYMCSADFGTGIKK